MTPEQKIASFESVVEALRTDLAAAEHLLHEAVDGAKEHERVEAELRAENQRLAGEVSRSREMLDSMNSDFHHLQANADTVCAALNELRAENQRLRTALDGLIDGARIAWRDLLECAQVANSHVQVSEGNPEFPAARLFHRAGLERTEEVMLILGKATETARAALSPDAPTAATPDPSKEA